MVHQTIPRFQSPILYNESRLGTEGAPEETPNIVYHTFVQKSNIMFEKRIKYFLAHSFHSPPSNGAFPDLERLNAITVAASVSELIAFPSSNPAQGTHKWVGMLITTGLADITSVKYNGFQLTAADATEATTVGGSAGDIVMWLKCDEIINTPKVFTLWTSGYPEATFTVVITEPEE